MNQDRIRQFCKEMFGIELYDYQLDFLLDCFNHKRILGVWSRQIGKSTCVAIFSCLYAILNNNTTIIITASADRQSKEIYKKLLGFCHKVKEFKESIHRETQDETTFINQSRILCLPVGDDGSYIRGYTADVLIEDEACFINDEINDEVLEPFLATKSEGKLIKISTPRGKVGHFYRCFLNPAYRVHHYDFTYGVSNGLIAQDFIDAKRIEMDSLSFAQEYCSEFIDEADCYFTSDLISNAINTDYTMFSEVSEIPKGEYYLGCDPSRLGSDISCFIVVKRGERDESHKVVFIKEIAKSTLDKQGDYILQLHRQFNFRRIYLDETGLGSGLGDYLAQTLNPNRKLTGSDLTGSGRVLGNDVIVGITFTNQSKKDLYSNLRTLFENRQLTIPNHPKLVAELKDLQYEYSDNGTLKIFHPPNRHDDFPDALCLAVKEVGLQSRKAVFGFLDTSNNFNLSGTPIKNLMR